MEDQNKITYFAETDFRNKKTPFGIKATDRTRHIYIIGKTGMGKSTLLENMAAQDIQSGNGMAFIDPHGSAINTLIEYIPESRIDDVVYFAPFDVEYPMAFNVMEDVGPTKRHLVAQGLLSSFKKIWGAETFSDRMEHITSNTLLALLEYPGSTMLSIPRMFVDAKFQKKVIANITDISVKNFWEKEYGSWDDRYKREAYAAVLNKIGQFTSNPIIRNIVGQAKSSFDFRKIMDEKKILLVNLSIGQIGESNANLLGSMMTTKIYLAAMSRADATKDELKNLPNFYLYIDEFQNLANDSFADILSQARKYKLNLTMAHQYVEQMPEAVSSAVFGNVGTMIIFRIGSFDAEIFEKEFSPTFTADDIVNLGFTQIYLKLMIDGIGSAPFSASTLPPIKRPAVIFTEEVIEASRKSFAKPKAEVEEEIRKWNEPIADEDKKDKPKKDEKVGGEKTAERSFERVGTNDFKTFEKKRFDKDRKPNNPNAPMASRVPFQSREIPQPEADKFTPENIEKPILGGFGSLKEALQTALQKDETVEEKKDSYEVARKRMESKERQRDFEQKKETENQQKLKNALAEALSSAREEAPKEKVIEKVFEKPVERVFEDVVEEKIEEKKEENVATMTEEEFAIKRKQPMGVPEEVLREILKDDDEQ